MKIKQADASFGCLQNAHLTFEDGLNLLRLPNEGGKSTWCAFLRVMLYGLDTKARDRTPTKDKPLGILADKNRYAPLNGAPMSGRLLIEWEGREAEIIRSSGKSGPMQRFSARWTDTGEAIEGMTGENCGELLCGVSREGYEKSAYIGSSGPVSAGVSPDLESRINAIVTSGREEISAETLRSRLNRMENDLYVNKSTGALARARTERNEAEKQIEGLQSILRRQKEWEGRRIEAEERRKAAEERLSLAQEHERFRRSQLALEALKRVKDARREESLRMSEVTFGGVQIDENWIEEGRKRIAKSEEAEAQASREGEREQEAGAAVDEARKEEALHPTPVKERNIALFYAVAAIGALVLAAGVLGLGRIIPMPSPASWALLIAGALMIAIAALLRGASLREARQKAKEAEERCREAETALASALARAEQAGERAQQAELEKKEAAQALMGHFAPLGVFPDAESASSRMEELEAALSRLQQATAERHAAEARLSGISSVGMTLHVPKPAQPPPKESEEELAAALRETESDLRQSEQECAALCGQLREAGEPSELFARKEALAETEKMLEMRLEGVRLARQAVEEAAKILETRISPRLTERAALLLEKMTVGKYQRFVMQQGFVPQAAGSDYEMPMGGAMLSSGTADQLYFALRLAICIEALADKKPPILLDDPFVACDDDRLDAAMKVLRELAEEWQIILFTCRGARIPGGEEGRQEAV